MKYINGGVTAAKGFKASGIYVGIKKRKKIWHLYIVM